MKDGLFWLLFGLGVLAIAGGGELVNQVTGTDGIMGNLSPAQIAMYANNAGFSGQDLINAVAIALAESKGNPNAHGDIDLPKPGYSSYGLWQINSYYWPQFGPDFTVLFDPQTNANAAFSVYTIQGFNAWIT
jgi:hypothetical protein